MLKKGILRILNFIIGCSLGIALLPFLWAFTPFHYDFWTHSNFVNGLIGGVIFGGITLIFENKIIEGFKIFEHKLTSKSFHDLVVNFIGIIAGLIIGALLSIPLYHMNLDVVDNVLPIALMLLFSYFGYYISQKKASEFRKICQNKNNLDYKTDQNPNFKPYKILDTNVIIDGRIYDIAKSGFIEGTLLIPEFVLYELQYIADSSDNLKRVRGRRGLDILNLLQKEPNINVEMYHHDIDDADEVDTKLIYLAKKLNGAIITNDYNLNKVSEFQNVQVLNINELANAVKPIVITGDKMEVTIVKEGTEKEQGVAYLDDGTMIVVENGMQYMGKKIQIDVTSSLQTAAGRMVFAKPIKLIEEV